MLDPAVPFCAEYYEMFADRVRLAALRGSLWGL